MKNINVPMPPGPFASWPADSREPALQGLRSRCLFLTGMIFDNFRGPPEAIGLAASALTSGCVANAMPDDWPGRGNEFDLAKTYEERARDLMPRLEDLAALAKMAAQALKAQTGH